MICILSPYGRNEVTAAAIRLADLAVALGEDVRLVACKEHEKNVHPFWDGKVWSGRADGVYYAARGCNTFVHFLCDPILLEMTQLVAEKARQILVPSWHRLRPGDEVTCKRFDHVVCPSRLMHKWFTGEVREAQVNWCRWDSSLPAVTRDGTVGDSKTRVLFICDKNSIDFCGPMTINLAGELLDMFPRLEVSMVSTKSWCRYDRGLVRRLVNRHPARFKHAKAGNFAERARAIHLHDWTVFPSVRADFGITVSRALACGTPCIVHDVEPMSELVSERNNGLLVPCEVRCGALKAPFAVPAYGKWLEVCAKAFGSNRLLFEMQQRDWGVRQHQRSFNEFWGKLWAG